MKYDAKSIVEEERQKYERYKADYVKQHSWPNSPQDNLDPLTPDGTSSKGYHSDPSRQAGGAISPEQLRLIHHERQPAMFLDPFEDPTAERKIDPSSGLDSCPSSFERKSKGKNTKPVYTVAAIKQEQPLKSQDPATYGDNYPQTYPGREQRPHPVLGSPARGRRAWAEGRQETEGSVPQGHGKMSDFSSYEEYKKHQQAAHRSQEDLSWEQDQERPRISYQGPRESHIRDGDKYRQKPAPHKKYNDYVNIEVFWNQQGGHDSPRQRSSLPPAGERAVLPPGNQLSYSRDRQQWQQKGEDAYYYYEKETKKYPMPQQQKDPHRQQYESQEKRKNAINAAHYQINLKERPSSAPVAPPQGYKYEQPTSNVPPGYQHFQASSEGQPLRKDDMHDTPKLDAPKKETPKQKHSQRVQGSPQAKDRKSRKEQYDHMKQAEVQKRRSWNENLPEFQRTIAVHTPSPSPDRRRPRRSWSKERAQSGHQEPQDSSDTVKEAGVYFSKATAKSQEDLLYETKKPSPLHTPTSVTVVAFPKPAEEKDNNESTYVEVAKILSNKRQQSEQPLTQKSAVSIPIQGSSPSYKQEVAFSVTGVRKEMVGPPKRVVSSTHMPPRPASTDLPTKDKPSKPPKFNIAFRSKSFDDLDSEGMPKVDLNARQSNPLQSEEQSGKTDVQNELHLILNKQKGTVESIKSEVFNDGNKEHLAKINPQLDDEDRPIFDYVSYKDGEKYPKGTIQDALTDLEQTFEALNLDKDIDEEFEPPKTNVKRLSITNLKKFEELQQQDGSPTVDYTRQWIDDTRKPGEPRPRSLAGASPASMEVASLSLPPEAEMAPTNLMRSASAGSEVKYYITGVQRYPKRKSDDMAYRKNNVAPRPQEAPYEPQNTGFLRQRSYSASKIEVVSSPNSTDYLQDRTTSPRRGQLRSRPDKEADIYHEDMAYRRLRKDIPPIKTAIPERYAQMRVEYSLRGRSHSLDGLRDQPPAHHQEPKVTYVRQKSDPTQTQGSQDISRVTHHFEPRRVFGSAPDLSDSSYGDYTSDDPRLPRSAIKVKKQQTPRTVKQRHEMKVKIKHLKTGDSYIYAVDSETESSSGTDQQAEPRKSPRTEPQIRQIPVRKAYYDNTHDMVSQESNRTYLVDESSQKQRKPKSPALVPEKTKRYMSDFTVQVRPSPRSTYLLDDRVQTSTSHSSQSHSTQMSQSHSTQMSQSHSTQMSQSHSSHSLTHQEREHAGAEGEQPPPRPSHPAHYHPEQAEGLPGPMSIVNDTSQNVLQMKLQEVKRDQDSTTEAKLVEAYEAKIKKMRDEHKKQRPYSMTGVSEVQEWPRKEAGKGRQEPRPHKPQLQARSASVENVLSTAKPQKKAKPEIPRRIPPKQSQIRVESLSVMASKPDVVRDTEGAIFTRSTDESDTSDRGITRQARESHTHSSQSSQFSSSMASSHKITEERSVSASHSASTATSSSITCSVNMPSLSRSIPVSHEPTKIKLTSSSIPKPAERSQDASDTAAKLVQSASSLPVVTQRSVISDSQSKTKRSTFTYKETSSHSFKPVKSAETESGIPQAAIARTESGIPTSIPKKQSVIQSSQKKVQGPDYDLKESNYSSVTKSRIPGVKAVEGTNPMTPTSNSMTRTTVGMSKSSTTSSTAQKQKMQIVVQHEKLERKLKQPEPLQLKQIRNIKQPVKQRDIQSPASIDDSFDTLDALVARQPEMSADELEVTDNEVMTDDTDAQTDIIVTRAMKRSKKPETEVVEETEETGDESDQESDTSNDEQASRREKRHLEPERRRSIKELVDSFESKMSPFMKTTAIPIRRCSSHESLHGEDQDEKFSLKEKTGSEPDLAPKAARRPPRRPNAKKDRAKVVSSNW